MIVGVPREVKSDEYRVAMLPVGAEELTAAGHTVLVEVGAGTGQRDRRQPVSSGGGDHGRGRRVDLAQADLIVKVKEPQPSEWPHLREARSCSLTSTSPPTRS